MSWLFDLKYAYRMLLKNPGFSGLTIGVMAAGIGLCTYMLAFLGAIMLRPLPFDNGANMYVMDAEVNGVMYNGGALSLHDYDEIKRRQTSFSKMGAYYSATANLSNGDRAVRYAAINTTANVFSYTGVSPLMGRAFNEQDMQGDTAKVAIIGYELWQDYFNGDVDIVGKTVTNNGNVVEIIGVMPEGFLFPVSDNLWLPLTADVTRVDRKDAPNVASFVMLKSGVTLEQAQQEVRTIMADLEKLYPESNSNTSAYVTTFQMATLGNGTETIIGLMLTAVFLVLILACVNVGNLLFARANERAKETAIRVALGAPKWRLISQMMWESVIICLMGGLFGLFSAAWGMELTAETLPKILPMRAPYYWVMEIDNILVMQAIAIILATAIVTGIIPSLKMINSDFNSILRDGTRGAQSKRAGRVNRILVIIEVALSCILLSMSSVLVFLLSEVNETDYGANIDNKLQARIGLPSSDYSDERKAEAYFQRLTTKLASQPGVVSTGAMSSTPGNGAWRTTFEIEGMEVTDKNYPRASQVISYQGSMQALDITLVEGRYFSTADRPDSLPVAIVTDSLAEKYWPDESALGKRINWLENDEQRWVTIVGVVKHTIHGQPYSMNKYRPSIYMPFSQNVRRFMTVFVELKGDASQFQDTFNNIAATIDPMVPTYNMTTIRDQVRKNVGGMNFINQLFTLFAVCALILASSGIYGVLSNSTAQRTQEIGIRRAIGASDQNIMSMLMRQGWWQLAIGLFFGLPLGYLASQAFVGLIGPESNTYLWAFAIVPILITLVVSLATYVPAKKAIKLEPSSALRYE